MMSQTVQLPPDAQAVLDFWFGELKPEQWWKQDDDVDRAVVARFSDLYDTLADAVPREWLGSPQGRLAGVIVLDQFPRNMFRNDPRAYDTDGAALRLADETIEMGWDAHIEAEKRAFLYMPFQHSEDAGVQRRSVELFSALGNEDNLDFAIKHKDIIDRFGRFPHRNDVLGRESSEAEVEFLKGPALFW